MSDGREESNHHSEIDGRDESNRLSLAWLTLSQDVHVIDQLSERYSSWQTLIRVLAYILRFISICKKQASGASSYALELSEYNAAKTLIIKHIQQRGFADEISSLQSGNVISKKSNVSKLCPFLAMTYKELVDASSMLQSRIVRSILSSFQSTMNLSIALWDTIMSNIIMQAMKRYLFIYVRSFG